MSTTKWIVTIERDTKHKESIIKKGERVTLWIKRRSLGNGETRITLWDHGKSKPVYQISSSGMIDIISTALGKYLEGFSNAQRMLAMNWDNKAVYKDELGVWHCVGEMGIPFIEECFNVKIRGI